MVSTFELAGIAIGMGMDVFSVSMAVAAGPRTPRQSFRLSWHFGLFQFLMPLIGWVAGKTIVGYVSGIDHWIAFALLAGIGGHMIWEGLKPEEEKSDFDRSRGWSLVALSIATSLDALAVGLSFGVLGGRQGFGQWESEILYPAFVIGVTSAIMSLIAIQLGRRLRSQIGHRMEIVGGVILIAIGVKFIVDVYL
jgi:manganese efflux pump family protein